MHWFVHIQALSTQVAALTAQISLLVPEREPRP
jgi:hypothetical protein